MKLLLLSIFILFANVTVQAQKTYVKLVRNASVEDMVFTKNNETIIAVTDPEKGYYKTKTTYIYKLSDRGALLWSKKYTYPEQYLTNTRLAVTKEKGFIAVCRIDNDSSTDYLLFKADSSGVVLWSKKINIYTDKYYFITYPGNITEAADGSIYFVHGWADDGIFVEKFDTDGNQLWKQFFYADDSINESKNFDLIAPSSENGVVISITSFFRNTSYKYYNKLYKFFPSGAPEWKYTSTRSSDNYTFSQALQSNEKGELNILYNIRGSYNYVVLDPVTGQSKAFDIGKGVSSVQSFLRKNGITAFNGVSWPRGNLATYRYGITRNWSLITAQLEFDAPPFGLKIEKSDSLGRICPDYVQPISENIKTPVEFPFVASPLNLSALPGNITVTDINLAIENVDSIRTLCSGKAEIIASTQLSNANSVEENITTKLSLQVAPNPVINHIIVKGLNPKTMSHISIIDLNGKVIQTQKVQASMLQLNVNTLAKGSYLLVVDDSNSRSTKPFLKL